MDGMSREKMIEEFILYTPMLRKYIYAHKLGEYTDDILQDTALAIWAGSLYKGVAGVQFRSWVKVIVHNIIVMKLRGRKNREHLNVDDFADTIPDVRIKPITEGLIVEEELADARRIIDLWHDSFPRYRTAVAGYMNNGGKIVIPEGVNINTHKTNLHRGLNRLRNIKRNGG